MTVNIKICMKITIFQYPALHLTVMGVRFIVEIVVYLYQPAYVDQKTLQVGGPIKDGKIL
uniref:Uncharacterized protein n=2 Tax=viral metagenome TaxID=1070528 RepID=A0A6M3JAQ7_9ZZZZ